ncbi:MAG: ArsR family transcriptional regulator [Candidatus Margulisiibacteriota bacterium]
MLEHLFGNKTAERVLLHIFHYGETYAREIALDLSIPATPVLYQLIRFERSGVLISRQVGKAKVFRFNDDNPLTQPVRVLIGIVYDRLDDSERSRFFKSRS